MAALETDAISSEVGNAFGKYHPLFELGRGGMATVMLAVIRGPAGFNKLQVIKILLEDLASEEDFLTMFLEEARLSARLNHPNVAQTNEVGCENGKYFIAMEYLEGHSFEEIFRYGENREGMPLAIGLYILIHALAGLHYAHELTDFQDNPLSVVHRDVSPQNIFVTYDGQVKVVDFGIAKAANSKIETQSGVIKGKVAYMAREQLGGEMVVDRRADLFAVGAVLWRLLAGQRLWRGLGDFEIFRRLINNEVPAPSSVKEGIDPELEALCMKALSFEPDERYPTAADFQATLERYVEKSGARASGREVGEYVRTAFATRRAKIKSAIESRLNEAVETGGIYRKRTSVVNGRFLGIRDRNPTHRKFCWEHFVNRVENRPRSRETRRSARRDLGSGRFGHPWRRRCILRLARWRRRIRRSLPSHPQTRSRRFRRPLWQMPIVLTPRLSRVMRQPCSRFGLLPITRGFRSTT